MRKKIIFLFLIIVSVCICYQVNAASYRVTRTGNPGASVRNSVNGSYGMNFYTASVEGQNLMTYCVDAGRAYGQNGTYSEIKKIDPSSGNKLDLAYAAAYYVLQQNGWNTTDATHRVIGEIAFRWLTEAYSPKSCYSIFSGACGSLATAKSIFRAPGKITDSRYVAQATQAYNAGVAAANAGYEASVAAGLLWAPKWKSSVEYVTTASSGNSQTVKLTLQPETEFNAPGKFLEYAESFSAGCSNPTVECSVNNKSARQDVNGVTIEMNIMKKDNFDGQDYGIYVDAAYCDARDAAAQLILLQKNGSTQRMLVVVPGTCPASAASNSRVPRGRVTVSSPRNDESCFCDTSTGEYKYEKYKDGNLVASDKWYATDRDSESKKNKYGNCPGTCEKKPTCQIIDNQPYCKDGEKCDQEKYDKECKHTCQTPEQSGDGNYYCNESSPGAGDGPICTEKEYRRDCLGEVACNPNVTVPSDCNNFDTASKYNGKISDINKVSTSCNPDINQVKSCVLDNKDATGASFENTSEISGNPYCKVWCAEDYSFELPTAQYSKSGGYFTLSTKIVGTRDCYVGGADNPKEAIDTTKFNNDFANAQKEVIRAWNEYNKWKQAAATPIVVGHDSDTHSHSCGEDCSYSHTSTNTTYTKDWTWVRYDENTGRQISNGSEHYYDKDCNGCGCSDGYNPHNDHIANRDSAKRTLIAAVEKLNSIIANYNSCTGVITNTNYSSNLTNVNPSSTTESSWENDMKFDPKVQFVYNEDYMSQLNGEFKQVDDNETSKNTFCSGDTDAQYKCQSGSTSTMQFIPGKTYYTCDESGCGIYSINISNAKWIQKSKTHTAEYKPNNQFSTYTQYGTIKFKWDQCSGNDCLWTNLPDDAVPVMLAQKSGVFPFKFTFTQIGQSNSTGNIGNGRLIGETVSVLTEYNKLDKSETCNSGGKVSATADGGYVCHYLNNCDDCDFICEDGVCDFDDDGDLCGTCDLTCETCLFDGDRAMYSFRIVSLNNLFTNTERRIGYNWYNGGTSGRPENEKATVTREEIDEAGESIYDKPQYEFVLEPGDMKNIREYNNAAGSYTNSKVPDEYTTSLNTDNAIYCEKVTLNGKEYNVRCKSSFLDLIENSGKTYASEMTRITSNNSNVGGESNNGWELYTETDYCKDGKCLTHGIGPSWRIRSVS